MSKSNGKRRVNKTDGPKKRGKKQMTKSRRVDAKKESEPVPMSKNRLFDNSSDWLDDEPWRTW